MFFWKHPSERCNFCGRQYESHRGGSEKIYRFREKHHYKVIGYYFEPDYELSQERNNKREGKEKVPEIGMISTLKKLQRPSYCEGFDELYIVKSLNDGFEIQKLPL